MTRWTDHSLTPPCDGLTGTEWRSKYHPTEGNYHMPARDDHITEYYTDRRRDAQAMKSASPYIDHCHNNTLVRTSAMDNCVTVSTAMQANQVFVVQKPVAVPETPIRQEQLVPTLMGLATIPGPYAYIMTLAASEISTLQIQIANLRAELAYLHNQLSGPPNRPPPPPPPPVSANGPLDPFSNAAAMCDESADKIEVRAEELYREWCAANATKPLDWAPPNNTRFDQVREGFREKARKEAGITGTTHDSTVIIPWVNASSVWTGVL